jgi:hypothetical protein
MSQADTPDPIAEQAQQQTGQQQVRLRVNDANMTTSYCNAFRTNTTAEEVFLDFGVNMLVPNPQAAPQEGQVAGEIEFVVNDRVIMNYYTAKRLALLLGQVIRNHEQRFGTLELNAQKRSDSTGG